MTSPTPTPTPTPTPQTYRPFLGTTFPIFPLHLSQTSDYFSSPSHSFTSVADENGFQKTFSDSKTLLVHRLYGIASYITCSETIPSEMVKVLHAVVDETEAAIIEFEGPSKSPLPFVSSSTVTPTQSRSRSRSQSPSIRSSVTSIFSVASSKLPSVEHRDFINPDRWTSPVKRPLAPKPKSKPSTKAAIDPSTVLSSLESFNAELSNTVASLCKRAKESAHIHKLTVSALSTAAERIITLEKGLAELKTQNSSLRAHLSHRKSANSEHRRRNAQLDLDLGFNFVASLPPSAPNTPPTPHHRHRPHLSSPINLPQQPSPSTPSPSTPLSIPRSRHRSQESEPDLRQIISDYERWRNRKRKPTPSSISTLDDTKHRTMSNVPTSPTSNSVRTMCTTSTSTVGSPRIVRIRREGNRSVAGK
ncbi:MAG: hypothetical protein M1834_002869 [Cirrosporium novae-zelandiae]|nr:MAG: hypothetical protein M1834_002869 [Cirrosporium novae-zelandiae]